MNSHLHLPQVAQWLIRQGGITREQLAMVSVLMSRQAARHPEALTRKAHTLEEVGVIVLGSVWATAQREVAKSWGFHFCGFEWIDMWMRTSSSIQITSNNMFQFLHVCTCSKKTKIWLRVWRMYLILSVVSA